MGEFGAFALLSLAAGVVLVAAAVVDLLATVIWVSAGPGPITGRLGTLGWRLALRFHRSDSHASHIRLSLAGPILAMLVIVTWFAVAIVGWSLVFVLFAEATATSWTDRLVTAGAAVVGWGSPAVPMDSAVGEWSTILARATGVAIVSLGLAYVIPIVGAVAHKRRLAAEIHVLGATPTEIVERARRAPQMGSLHLHLVRLVPEINLTAQRHVAYPILHFFHSPNRRDALAPSIAALSLLIRDPPSDPSPLDATVLEPLGRSIGHLVSTLRSLGLEVEEEGDGPASAEPSNVPGPATLRAYVRFDGWEWQELGYR